MSANRAVVGLLREGKSTWERRAALSPEHVAELVRRGVSVLVQPSSRRVFADAEYERAGATLQEDLSPAVAILGVKEVPVDQLLADKTYCFFSHTIKAQPYNMGLLDALLEKNIRMVDIECITEGGKRDAPRLVAFGKFAGLAGMVDTQRGLGERLLALGHSNPFLTVGSAYMYKDLAAARQAVTLAGEMIQAEGTPAAVGPLTFVFTGAGNVSRGAQSMFQHLPHEMVAPHELADAARTGDLHKVYGCVADVQDFIRAPGQPDDVPLSDADKARYFANPGDGFRSVFHEQIAPHSSVIMNCMYWSPDSPRILTSAQQRASENSRLLVVGDISCDVGGSIEFLTHTTDIEQPFYMYDPATDSTSQSLHGNGVVMCGVDILPSELPRDSTEYFGAQLLPFVESMATEGAELPAPIAGASITADGKLQPEYEYIQQLRAANEAAFAATQRHPIQGTKRVLVLGTGMVAPPLVGYLNRIAGVEQTLASALLPEAEALAGGRERITAVELDVSDTAALSALIESHDLVISLVPAPFHPVVAGECMKHGIDMVTASYLSAAMPSDEEAKAAGITIINEVGLDPGIDHMSAMAIIDEVKAQGGTVDSFKSYCGGLPAPEACDNPLGYKFSWNPKGVLTAGQNAARYLYKDKVYNVEGPDLLASQRSVRVRGPALALEMLPNRDSVPYKGAYALDEAHTVLRGTLRYEQYCHIMSTFSKLGLFSNDAPQQARSWRELMAELVPGAVDEAGLRAALAKRPEGVDVDMVMEAVEFLGLQDDARLLSGDGKSVVDELCALLQEKLAYAEGERDMVLLHHDFEITNADGSRVRKQSSLLEYGVPGGDSAMATTVGVPTAIAAALLLDGTIQRKGCYIPVLPDIYAPILKILEEGEGIKFSESEVTLVSSSRS